MKLHNLTLSNFNIVDYAEIPLADTTFLVGMNGHGKSTVHEAIQLALMGWCEHTDRRGAGYAEFIRTGAAQAIVELEFSHAGTAYRISLTLGKKREWMLTEIDTGEIREDIATPAALWEMLGINATHALVCMYPSQIVNSKEFSGILSDYLRAALTPEALTARVPAEHRDWFTALAARKHIRLDSVVAYESLGQACYDRRTEINRDLKLVNCAIQEMGFLKPVTTTDGKRLAVTDIPDLTAQRAAFDETLRGLYTQLGAAQAAPATGPTLAECEAELAAAESETSIAALFAALDAALSEMHRANDAAAEAATIETPTHCPTCGGKFTKAKREEYTAAARAAAEEWQERALAAKNAAQDATAGLTRPEGDSAERLRDARQSLEITRRMPPPYTGEAAATIEARITDTQAQIQYLDSLLSALTKHRELAEAQAHAAALTAELEHVVFVVKEFHDGAAYRELLAAAAAPIVARVNTALGSNRLAIQPDGKAFLLTYNGRALSKASRGERATVAFAMATAFAECGAPVLLDETNELDPLNRGALCMRLRTQSVGSVVLAGTPLSIGPEYLREMAARLAPMQIVAVNDGTYRVIPAAVEAVA